MADETKTESEETEAPAAEPPTADDPNREGIIAALRRERAGYVQRGLDNRVAAVDAELKRLGAAADDDRDQAAPRENTAESKPRQTASRGGKRE